MTSQKPMIGFAGLTHLGLVMATTTRDRGYPIVCYGDLSTEIVEPGLEASWAQEPMRYSSTSIEGLGTCDLVFVTLDTPLSAQSRPDEKPVLELVEKVIPFLHGDAVLVIMSQVSPGFTRKLNFPKERLFYQAETLIFGESVDRATQPNRLIVGCADPAKGIPPRYYSEYLLSFDCAIHTMRYESAEMAKIAINMMLISQISTTNTLSELCEHVDADWREVVKGLEDDPRIGTYLQPGLGLGGGHIERDLRAVTRLCGKYDVDISVPHAFLTNSEYRRSWLWETLVSCTDLWRKDRPRVAILGLAYKPDTASIVNSPGARLAEMLSQCTVAVFDPLVPLQIQESYGSAYAQPEACIADSDALIVATAASQFRRLDAREIMGSMNGKVIIDPYRVLDGEAFVENGFEYHAFGVRLPFE